MSDFIIDEICISPISPKNGLLGFANFSINGDFRIENCAIYTAPNSPTSIRLVYPIRQSNIGAKFKTVYPLHSAVNQMVDIAICNEYLSLLEKMR